MSIEIQTHVGFLLRHIEEQVAKEHYLNAACTAQELAVMFLRCLGRKLKTVDEGDVACKKQSC